MKFCITLACIRCLNVFASVLACGQSIIDRLDALLAALAVLLLLLFNKLPIDIYYQNEASGICAAYLRTVVTV